MSSTYSIPIEGVRIGHAIDAEVVTGTSTCLFDEPATTAIHIAGGAPGTRDTELLSPEFTVGAADAIVLSGGSAFGLDAAGGAQAWLKEQNRGIELEPVRIPIVPCAILFDMRNDGNKNWGRFSPSQNLGYQATETSSTEVRLGKQGAAYGASTASTPGGFGAAHIKIDDISVMAFAAVNAVGSPLIADTKHFWAAPFERNNEYGGRGFPNPWPADADTPRTKAGQRVAGANTTLAIVVTDAVLTPSQAKRIAMASHDGFARALYPVHTSADGDLTFVASTGRKTVTDDQLIDIGIQAANVVSRAIARGVYVSMQEESKQEAPN
ncbi:MAG: peptidase T4 [Pseudomonadales bacterium]|nr:peptidase T4 [Pseudomonadales bacterium]